MEMKFLPHRKEHFSLLHRQPVNAVPKNNGLLLFEAYESA